MTLVVAQQKGNVISIVSDTGIMEHDVKLPPEKQVPKICILNEDLAVAFAGSADLAVRYLEEFPRKELKNYSEVTKYFLKCHQESNGSVDFLVLFNKPQPKIVPIYDSRIYPARKKAWIGDKLAYEAFQRYHNLQQADSSVASILESPKIITIQESEILPNNRTFKMLGTLRYVMINPKIESVFGVGVAVNNVEGWFQYRSHTFVLAEKRISLALPETLWNHIASEREELRNYAVSCFVADPACSTIYQAIAYHFMHGKFTYMYYAKKGEPLTRTKILTGKNIQEFLTETKQEFDIDWIGTVVSRTTPPKNYGVSMNQWKQANKVL